MRTMCRPEQLRSQAIVKCVNLLGDADTTGAICAQIVGAFYGADDIEPAWRADLRRWDEDEIELRAIALFVSGLPEGPAAE